MQKQSLIPTPLPPLPTLPGSPARGQAEKPRARIEIVEPTLPSRWRVFLILGFFLGEMMRNTAATLWPRLKKTRYTEAARARRVRLFMEKMGGLWVKAGQIVALRRDLLSEDFCAELRELQDRARGFPGSISRRIIEEDLGQPLENVFDDFDESPLAAASIGQVHRARLRESNVDVVIKVLRPNISAIFTRDLRYLYILVWLLDRGGVASHFRWMDMYAELESSTLDELDYRQEAASIRRMRKQLRSQKIYVPKVFLDFCSDRILVMEMVRGVYMSQFIRLIEADRQLAEKWLEENDISPRKAGERLLFSHYQQLFEDNFYHGDLHPGNIMLMRKNRITLIDFGSVGSSDRTALTRLLQVFMAVGNRDYRKVADLFMLMAPELPNRDLADVKEQIVQAYRKYEPLTKIKSLEYHKKSLGAIAGDLLTIMGNAGIAAGWDLLRANRAEITLDASLMYLLPSIDYPKTLRTYVRKMRQRQQKAMQRIAPIREGLAKLSEQVDLPTKAAENAYFEGEYLRKRARRYEGYVSKAAKLGLYIFVALSRALRVGAVASVILLLHQRFNILYRFRNTWLYEGVEKLPQIDTVVWFIIVIGMVYLSTQMVAMQRVLEQPEPSKTGRDSR